MEMETYHLLLIVVSYVVGWIMGFICKAAVR